MTTDQTPRVSIGLPVYNGERYITQALDALLAQTFQDFELIISDNGSTDATERICRAYAERDKRIRYYRSEYNRGFAWNFTRVFELSRGEYFRWACHDDVCAPEFVARCVEVLDNMPDVVLAHSRLTIIDDQKQVMDYYDVALRTDAALPHERFYELIRTTHYCAQIFGLMRASVVQTIPRPLQGDFTSPDLVFLARLGLRGRFYEIPAYLFSYRRHTQQSMHLDRHERATWYNPAHAGRIVLPEWRLFWELCVSVVQASLPWTERAWCFLYLLCWPSWSRHWRRMGKDVARASLQLVGAPAHLVRSR